MKNLIILSALCLFLLVGCQQSVDDLVVNENYPISIEASIGDAGGSRYAGNTPNVATFTEGDNIGLAYKVGTDNATSFVKWTLNDGSWNPATEMNWKNIGDDHTFYAFYPYNTGASLSVIPMPDLANQDGTMVSVAERDFLVATKTMKYSNGGKVSFTGDDAFDHVSSLIVLTLKNAEDLASATINNITLTGTNLVAESTYSFDDGEVTWIDSRDSDDIMSANISTENSAMVGDFRKFYFVVNSGTVNLSEVTLGITYTSAGGEVYKASKTDLSKTGGHTQFQKGHSYNYGITITTDQKLTISGHTINTWQNGGSFDITIDNSEKQNQNS
jgi:hypothetical protein